MMTEQMRCARHPNEETNLRCSRCERPTCLRCAVYTPVGIRCRECATPRRSGIYAPERGHLLRAAATGVGVALAAAVLWALFSEFGFWIALVLGFAGGELISLAADRRRGPEMQTVAALTVIGAFLLALLVGSALDTDMPQRLISQTLMAALALVLAVARQG